MLRVNDEHNDDLIRRAAENYPLKSDGADWEAMREKLDTPEDEETAAILPRKRNRRFLFLLLLLLPLSIFEAEYAFIRNRLGVGTKQPVSATTITSKQNNEAVIKSTTSAITQDNSTTTNSSATTASTIATQPESKTIVQTQTGNDPRSDAKDFIGGKVNMQTEPALVEDNQFTGSITKRKKRTAGATRMTSQAPSADTEEAATVTRFSTTRKKKSMAGKQRSTITKATATIDNENEIVKHTPINTTNINIDPKVEIGLSKADTVKSNAEKNNELTGLSDTLQPDKNKPVAGVVKNKKKDDNSKKKKHFYAGLVIGPDFSSIKLQSVKKVGLNYGVIAGYKLSKKFSVETGLLKDKKLYQTAGKYFTPKELIYPNAQIGDVTGECRMLEMPLNITYSFGKRKNSAWYALAGTSSYFMNSEYYAYNVSYYGIDYPYSANYKNKSTSLFAMINLGIGFTQKIGKIGDLRIEPFAKLPLKEIGSGNLPIQSAGIFIGFTKILF